MKHHAVFRICDLAIETLRESGIGSDLFDLIKKTRSSDSEGDLNGVFNS